MDKMKFETPNLTAVNVTKIAELFPGVVTEGKVNIDLLRSMLGDEVYGDEAYEFTWVGKRAAIAEAGRPIRKTLRPCVEESKDWDTTENLYIEGDNLDVLKLLQESYLGKVKMIYIDPPYNTGHDFIYNDNFRSDNDEYNEQVEMFDEIGNKQFRENTISNPRMHSDWCSMMYSRLVLARNILADDGLIFISIDDNEVENLKKICNEVFGSCNFVAQMNIITGANQAGEGVFIQKNVEYCLIYAKNIVALKMYRVDKVAETYRNLNDAPTPLSTRTDMGYTIYYNPNTKDIVPLKDYDKNKIHLNKVELVYSDNVDLLTKGYVPIRPGMRNGYLHRWRWGLETLLERKNEVVILEKNGTYTANFIQGGFNPPKNYQNFSVGTIEIKNLFNGNAVFDYSKGCSFLKYLISISSTDKDIILDFFSGSATTAHAVMQLNAQDGGNRKFIMVQLPEVCAEGTEAAKAGYKNICEIGKERIRRAGEKIKTEAGLTAQNLDVGFRVLKLDDTNMNDVYYAAGDYTQELLLQMESNIKPDRTDMDLLYGCLLDRGLPLSMPHSHEEIDGFTVHTYNDGDLIACFEEKISEKAIREIAGRCGADKRKGLATRAVFRDSGFISSPEKINVFEIFELLAPNTNVRVI